MHSSSAKTGRPQLCVIIVCAITEHKLDFCSKYVNAGKNSEASTNNQSPLRNEVTFAKTPRKSRSPAPSPPLRVENLMRLHARGIVPTQKHALNALHAQRTITDTSAADAKRTGEPRRVVVRRDPAKWVEITSSRVFLPPAKGQSASEYISESGKKGTRWKSSFNE